MSCRRLFLVVGIFMVIFSASPCAAEEGKADRIDDAMAALTGTLRERQQAVQTLAGLDQKDIVAHDIVGLFVKKIKEDENPRLQVVVVKALGTIANEVGGSTKNDISKALIDALNNLDASALVRGEAVYALSDIVDPDNYDGKKVKGTLEKLAADKKTPSSLRKACYDILARWGYDGIAPDLLKRIKAGDRDAIKTYIRLIINGRGKIKIPGTTASAFLRMAEDERKNAAFRIDLLKLLAIAIKHDSKIAGIDSTIGKIIKRSSDASVKLAAVEAIGRTIDADLIRILLKVYEENKGKEEAGAAQLRRAACAAAGEYFYPFSAKGNFAQHRSDLKKLSEMLVDALMNDAETQVCVVAASGLGNMSGKKYASMLKRPMAALIEALSDQDDAVSNAALDSLKFLTDEDFEKDLKAWRDWYRKNERRWG